MQRVVTDVLWYECVSVCLSVRLLACWSQPIEMSFAVWTLASRKNNVLGGGPDPLVQFGVKYREYLACGRYSQPYLVGGSSDEAFNASSAATYYTLTKIINSCSFLLGLNNVLLISFAL